MTRRDALSGTILDEIGLGGSDQATSTAEAAAAEATPARQPKASKPGGAVVRIAIDVDAPTRTALKLLAARQETTVSDLLREQIALLLR